jgi:rhomboid protease GluP
MNRSSEVELRSTPRREVADEWALVLLSGGIRGRVRFVRGTFTIYVDSTAELEAEYRLQRYEDENFEPEVEERPPEVVPGVDLPAGIGFGAAIMGFFLLTGPRDLSVAWFREGSATARYILTGELWRSVTALTLHADQGHALGNAVIGGGFFAVVCGILGPGVGLGIVVAAGTLGNLVNAWYHGGLHSSVGASTGVFGAVGVLAGLAVGRRSRGAHTRRSRWAPAAAGLGLLAMLGVGERSDVGAHVFGLIAGFALALPLGREPSQPLRAGWQWALGLLASTAIVACWWRALA